MNYDRAILRQNYITLKIKASIHEQLTDWAWPAGHIRHMHAVSATA